MGVEPRGLQPDTKLQAAVAELESEPGDWILESGLSVTAGTLSPAWVARSLKHSCQEIRDAEEVLQPPSYRRLKSGFILPAKERLRAWIEMEGSLGLILRK